MDIPAGGAARVATTAGAVALVAGVATWASNRDTACPRIGGVLATVGLGLALGVALRAVTVGLARGAEKMLGPERVVRLVTLRRSVARDAIDRGPVVLFHAFVAISLVGLPVVALGVKVALSRLRTVQDPALAEALGSLAATAVVAGVVLLAVLAWKPLVALLTRVDAARTLPLPASAPARAVLWVALPLVVVGGLGFAFLGHSLGPFAIPFAVVASLGVEHALAALLLRGPRPPSRAARALLIGVAIVAVGLTLADRVLHAWAGAAIAADSSPLGQGLLRASRAATDFDRDGQSSLFGGRDCAPLDRTRLPGAIDVPGNGVDEDCSGADADASVAMPTGARFSGLPRRPGRRPDIVWFVVDAVRQDHVGFLGYQRETTPNLDQLAKESVVFSRAVSQSSATGLSFPSFLTGIDPGRLTWRLQRERLQLGPGQPFVSKRLEALGYRTGFVAADYFKRRLPSLTEGWSWMHVSDRNQTESSASAAAHATKFLAQAVEDDAPFFLVVYMAGPHAPYVAHGPGYKSFGKSPIDLYDQEILSADRYIGFMLDLLREDAKRWADTVVVFNSDHGEEFGEHGGTAHARTCHAESVQVPLLVRLPGQAGATVDTPVGLIDVVPTLLELAGGTAREDELDGHSLVLPLRAPGKVPTDRPLFCSVVSQKAAQGYFFHRAVRSGRWVAMQELRSGGPTILYDAQADPGEQKPRTGGEDADISRRLTGFLTQQLTSNLGEMPLGDEP